MSRPASPFDSLISKIQGFKAAFDAFSTNFTNTDFATETTLSQRNNRCATLIDYLKDDGEILMYGIGIGQYAGNIYHFRAPEGSTPYDPVWEMVEFSCSTGQATCSLTPVTPYDYVDNVIPTTAEQNMAAYGTLFTLDNITHQCSALHAGSSGGWRPEAGTEGHDTGIVLQNQDHLSFACWIKIPPATWEHICILSNDDTNLGTQGEFYFYLTSDGNLVFDLQHPWHGKFDVSTGNTWGLNANTTHHIGFSINWNSGTDSKIYINGVQRGIDTHQNANLNWATSRSLHLGKCTGNVLFGNQWSNWNNGGCLDGAVIDTTEWPASTFLDLYNIGIGS